MKELFLNRRFFMFLWGGVFALLLTFVFPRVYPWVIWALGCGGGLVVVDITLLYGFGKAFGAQRIVGDKFSNGEENPVRIRVENKYPFAVRVRVVDEAPVEFQERNNSLNFCLSSHEHKEGTYFLRPVKRGLTGSAGQGIRDLPFVAGRTPLFLRKKRKWRFILPCLYAEIRITGIYRPAVR
ncbi:MAG: hypothetical protein ACLU6Z_10450 [Odoribacter splanchnicus]